MNKIIALAFMVLSVNVYALDCTDLAAQEVLQVTAETLGVSVGELKVRHIGGESFDGDIDSGNIYKDHSGEYFDVFLASEDPVTSKALQLYAVGIYIYSNVDSGEVLECENYSVETVDADDWSEIYETYL
jgi:hypothetical protein